METKLFEYLTAHNSESRVSFDADLHFLCAVLSRQLANDSCQTNDLQTKYKSTSKAKTPHTNTDYTLLLAFHHHTDKSSNLSGFKKG